ncbi:Peroxiredoxin-2, partial [Fragariocoptes setiger]
YQFGKIKIHQYNTMAGQVPLIGKVAPDFTTKALVNGQFEDVSLSKYKGKYIVLYFYPSDFTFVCPTEITSFSDRIDDFKAVDTVVLGVSTDSHFVHLAWSQVPRKEGGIGKVNYPLLGDKSGAISRSYGVLTDSGLPLRGLFIIDKNGILRQITINDFPVGRSIDEVLRLVQAFQFTDEHGEVCPAGWKPGSATIKPSAEASKEFFSKLSN